MADNQESQQRAASTPKMISIKDEPYYSNCTLMETTPFDISILFGKMRPRVDEKGQGSLVEVYEKQVYLSHLQARALYDALGTTLRNLEQQRKKVGSERSAPSVESKVGGK